MSRVPYLRLVDAPERGEAAVMPDMAMLGLVDMSSVSDIAFRAIISQLRPSWVFDLRPVPYFNVGRLNRKRAFELFRSNNASYRDVASALRITEHNDASLNSGAVGGFMSATLATRPLHAPVVVLLDDPGMLAHAADALPKWLGALSGISWRPIALDDWDGGASCGVVRP